MSNTAGCSPYCQECGACSTRNNIAASPLSDEAVINTIVEEVINTLKASTPKVSDSVPVRHSIPVGVSNRHIHLREESFRILFGTTAQPEIFRQLYQPGEFALKQTCVVIGPKMKPLQDVRILGPFREYDQVEVSFTDAITLGIDPPIRDSGKLKGAAPITIVGPAGSLFLEEGAILANRHIHTSPKDAALYGIKQGDFIRIQIPGIKCSIYDNVLVRVNDSWKLQLHLDTDDANAAHVVCNQEVFLLER